MKKVLAVLLLTAMVLAFGAGAAFAAEVNKVDTQGISFAIPEDIAALVTVKRDGLDEDTLVEVYETASIEASKALGENDDGAGWIFSIARISEERLEELRCGEMSGMEVFAAAEDGCYVYCHPTDVRMVRRNNDEMTAGLAEWSKIHEWAWGTVRKEILANNSALSERVYTNTYLDMLLAQAAFREETKYELRSLEYGPEALDPAVLEENSYLEELLEDYTYALLDEDEAPDGEYYVLAFDDHGEEVRFDFFKAEDSRNVIREVRVVAGEEYTTLYQATARNTDDAERSTTDVMEDWCKAIAEARKEA